MARLGTVIVLVFIVGTSMVALSHHIAWTESTVFDAIKYRLKDCESGRCGSMNKELDVYFRTLEAVEKRLELCADLERQAGQ